MKADQAAADTSLLSITAGIHGGDSALHGIHGGDHSLNGIHGGDSALHGIHGGDRQIFQSLAIGPIESITLGGNQIEITVLGQTFLADSLAETPSVGDYVIAAGSSSGLDVLLDLGTQYVPGASQVAVRGEISSLDSSVGQLSVGSLALDYSPALSSTSTFSPRIGQIVEFVGIQPTLRGIAISSYSSLQGIHGGDSFLHGIHGGDVSLHGIHGGDSFLQGIHGGDVSLYGIHGGGSSVLGIHGGDNSLKGIHGGDVSLYGIHGGDNSRQ
ncbi:MAG TPA: hypothetical protein VGC50_15395 [Gammaproteobacteria bacterium]